MSNDVYLSDAIVSQVNKTFVPAYMPLYGSLFSKTEVRDIKLGSVTYETLDLAGGADAKLILGQDTERKHFMIGPKSKDFNVYVKGGTVRRSGYLKDVDASTISSLVLNKFLKQQDKLVYFGDSTTLATIKNNGIYFSKDPDYITKTTVTTSAANLADINYLGTLFSSVVEEAEKADNGLKIILLSGAMKTVLQKFVPNTAISFKSALHTLLSGSVFFHDLPIELDQPSTTNGDIICVSQNSTMLRYVSLPHLEGTGRNAESNYTWFNFLYGSAAVEVLAKGGIVRQPITIA